MPAGAYFTSVMRMRLFIVLITFTSIIRDAFHTLPQTHSAAQPIALTSSILLFSYLFFVVVVSCFVSPFCLRRGQISWLHIPSSSLVVLEPWPWPRGSSRTPHEGLGLGLVN